MNFYKNLSTTILLLSYLPTNACASSGLHGLADTMYFLSVVFIATTVISLFLFIFLIVRFSKNKIKTKIGMSIFLMFSVVSLSLVCGYISVLIEDYIPQGLGEAIYFILFFSGGIYALRAIYNKVKPLKWPSKKVPNHTIKADEII